ncbi:hypothetical protein [Leptolyngbya sp. Heron Island J]|uniref:hypothetical protein n=1 Tax=Leptolyngbya sp. Heron Island J TaxID=1385935 RepID=UPI0012691524|nr:hypothetical protein [Leptolyngbya sp. Heron Island J]
MTHLVRRPNTMPVLAGDIIHPTQLDTERQQLFYDVFNLIPQPYQTAQMVADICQGLAQHREQELCALISQFQGLQQQQAQQMTHHMATLQQMLLAQQQAHRDLLSQLAQQQFNMPPPPPMIPTINLTVDNKVEATAGGESTNGFLAIFFAVLTVLCIGLITEGD